MQIRCKFLFSLCWAISFCQANSLWHENAITLFSDVRARNVGDIVKVCFEDLKIAAEADSNTPPETRYPFFKKLFDRVLHRTSYTLPHPYHTSETTLTKFNISMQVMDVLPNGNLVLEGVRKYKFWDTYKYEVVRGIARSTDIDQSNSLTGECLSHLTVDYGTGDSFEDAKRNGLISNLNKLLDPY